MTTQSLIALFESKAEVLEAIGSNDGLDEAILLLIGWMDWMGDDLSENDTAVLSDIGAILYREGSRKK